MKQAIIKDNNAHCPECGECNYKLTNDYRLVEINNNKYIEFVARCNKCKDSKFYFQSQITMNKHVRYAFNKKDEIEIKETDN